MTGEVRHGSADPSAGPTGVELDGDSPWLVPFVFLALLSLQYVMWAIRIYLLPASKDSAAVAALRADVAACKARAKTLNPVSDFVESSKVQRQQIKAEQALAKEEASGSTVAKVGHGQPPATRHHRVPHRVPHRVRCA